MKLLLIACLFPFVLNANLLKPISVDDLTSNKNFNKEFFKETNDYLDNEDFEIKWNEAIDDSPLMLMRSFVSTYYADFKNVKELGPIGICFGDLHTENFGFVLMEEKTEFLFNDFDDTGYCPILIDALRYFVALRLSEFKSDQINGFAKDYVAFLQKKKPAVVVPEEEMVDLDEKRKKQIAKYTENDKFVATKEKELETVNSGLKKKIIKQVEPYLDSDTKVLDVATYVKSGGGSGGLTRYWVLVNSNRRKEIIELKELVDAGTNLGNWGEEPSPRIEWAVTQLWENQKHDFYETIELEGSPYLIRSRNFDNLKIPSPKKEKSKFWVQAELSIIAGEHSESISQSDELLNELAPWLVESSKTIADRFDNLFRQSK